jgi:hypothetical protein
VLKDGTPVVTKVQRPLIADMIREDFKLLKKLASAVNVVEEADEGGEQTVDLLSVIEELEKVENEELDFRVEAENTRFFKENCIHRVSGNSPSSFQITTTVCRGVQRGSWRSLAIVGERVYYKSRQDVMAYDGSMPISVSEKLGGVLYSDARAGAVGDKYYVSMKDRSGTWHLFNYDTKTGIWHKEDGLRALGFGRVDDELFCIDEGDNTLVSINGSVGEPEDDFPWSATFGLFGTDFTGQKYLSRFNIRMYLDPWAEVKLEIRYDGEGDWEEMGTVRGNRLKSFLIPVIPRRCDHLQVRISGEGECRIYQISREMEAGGDG